MKTLWVSLSLYLSAFALQAQIPSAHLRDTVENRITTQLAVYPQEKIYLHTDRDYYIPGEKIWFKAYIADTHTHLPLTASLYVYVDLINESGLTVYHTTLRCIDDMYHGNIFLADVVPAGYYTIRAYTRYMENPNEDYFFRKQIRIGGIELNDKAANSTKTAQKKPDTKKEDYAVSFFPEGGNLTVSDFSRIAFKAVNSKGYGEQVSGKIVDESGKTIAEAATGYAGMGSVTFATEEGKRYFFHCTNSKGMAKQFELPIARKDVYSLSTHLRKQRLSVARTGQAVKSTASTQYLLVHCRGYVLHFAPWDNKEEYYTFPSDQLPTGVLQCLLLDETLNPLSERLVFNRGTDQASLAFKTNKESYKTREKIAATLRITDESDIPLTGSFSVSITDDKDIQPDNATTILSSLLLTSELKGYIESPGYYFEDNDPVREMALDNLMMTQGWRRYNIPEVLKGQIAMSSQAFETDMAISGKVIGGLFNRPVADGEVSLMSTTDNIFLSTKTNANGRFTFNDFEFADTLSLVLQARNSKNGSDVTLEVDPEVSLPGKALLRNESLFPLAPTPSAIEKTAVPVDPFMEKAKERSKYDEDMRVIYLNEVEVVANRPQRPKYSEYTNFASTVIDEARIERINPYTTEQLFMRIPGLQVTKGGVIRISRYTYGGGSGDGLPLLMIDGVEIASAPDSMGGGINIFDWVPIESVKAVEVMKGPDAAVLGLRAPNGAINIVTTNLGRNPAPKVTPDVVSLTRYGYQKPAEFYSPVYETEEQRFNILPDLRTTIWWKPDVVTTDEGEATFDFYASDYATTYSVVIEGLSDDGMVVRKVEKIKINP